MNTFLKAGMPVLSALVLAACGNNAAKTNNSDSTQQATTPAAAPAALQLKDDQLNAVYQQYQLLSQALVKGDAAAAKIAANALEAGARELTGAEQTVKTAASIIAAADIEAQRAAYATLSNDLIALVKKSGLNSGALYVDFCPMALNDKGGYWLSSEKGIQNPYFGDQMLTCGEVKETIQ
ncbi:DUF3347 domain-containing protein [Chitinophaga qingshengii]|uniref:DUF3347 domain-containing protein n=1 Tax=Chitinophaga qingshengii TaxID=1569794 RepID=A0ABR7TGL5_9BACT|nr:DUF3347 domain-containing protein [Chitinophaga qingshengii]MBC9929085.1 DUF3347 domain-containing protein [Chitinophaga qingshengii]